MATRLRQPAWNGLLWRRRVSLLMALVCLWLSTGATLRHSADDLQAVLQYPAGQAAISLGAVTAPDGLCAACEWAQTLRLSGAPAVPVILLALLFFAFLFPAPLVILGRRVHRACLRAPPAFPAEVPLIGHR